jgi:uncharacterized Zn finger protein
MSEEIETTCPACSPQEFVWHDVLKDGQNMLVRCQICGDVHPTETETEKTIPVRIVISRGDESFKTNALFEETQVVTTNEELVVEDQNGEDVYPIQITSIETPTKREEYAKIADVETIWARAIDEVDVKISVQSIGNTNPYTKRVPGEEIFEVGMEYEAGGERFRITRIKIRGGKFRFKRGDKVEAKYIKRIFGRVAYKKGWGGGRTAWSMKRNVRNW